MPGQTRHTGRYSVGLRPLACPLGSPVREWLGKKLIKGSSQWCQAGGCARWQGDLPEEDTLLPEEDSVRELRFPRLPRSRQLSDTEGSELSSGHGAAPGYLGT